MQKTKLLTIAVIGLLIINLGTLGFLVFGRPDTHNPQLEGRPEPKQIIMEKLHFDASQQKEYARLIQWHRSEIKKRDENIRQAKNALYSQLSQDSIDVKAKDSLISVINANQKLVEQTHFRHFEDIKKLCRKDQLEDFNSLTEELGRIFALKPHRPRHD